MISEEVINSSNKEKFSNEDKRQFKRKEKVYLSRFLDNYYNPEVIESKKSWWPNGLYILKKFYSYSNIGLCYNYEKNNTLQKRPVLEAIEKKEKIKHYVEYDLVEENEFIITIEYCSNCEEHQIHTQHRPGFFKNFASHVQKSIMSRFPFIKVLLKPIDTDIFLDPIQGNSMMNKTKVIDDRYREVRIGALEVQLCYKLAGMKNHKVVSLYSKLNSGGWPSIGNILNSIVHFLPRVDIEVKVYDKESSEEDQKNKEEMKNILNTKVQGINVVLYKLRNKKIEEIGNQATDELEYVLDPKKRKDMIRSMRKTEKESFGKINPNSNMSSIPSISGTKLDLRPNSSITKFNFEPGRTASTGRNHSFFSNSIIRPISTNSNLLSNRTLQLISNENHECRDKDQINLLKGEKLISLFTDENGVVSFKGLPHDSFLIEVVEGPNFQQTALSMNFKSITNETKVTKYIGLQKQVNSFLRVNVAYSKNPKNLEENQEVTFLSGANVVLFNSSKKQEEKLIYEESEFQIKLQENKEKNRYETVVVPGKYTLEVNYKGFDVGRKFISLIPGENIVTINMKKERKYNLKVKVVNYEGILPIENVCIKIKLGSEDVQYDNITDIGGSCGFLISMKEDFISIFAEKMGYFPAQRTYVKDVNSSMDELEVDGVITREIVLMMVKESFIAKENCTVMITYSNLIDENFEPVFLYSDIIGKYTDINCTDSQSENGVITSFFKFIPPNTHEIEESDKEEELEEIIRVMLRINSKRLKKEFKFNQNLTLNGMQRFSCETCLYTTNNMFFINSPSFSRETSYDYWDLGFLDVKNSIFYETSLLTKTPFEKNFFFFEWTNFLQLIIDNKIYSKLFNSFGFEKGNFVQGDRLIYEPSFFKQLRVMTKDAFTAEFMMILCDMFKTQTKMVSYSIFKKKLSSNLKNFRENFKITLNGSFGGSFGKSK